MSTDCGTGNYCAGNKRCACLTTYVEIDSYCWRKINPGESGCTQNRQCEAVWPGAYCRSGVNLILRTFQSFNSRRNAVAQTTNPLFAQGMVLFAWTTAFARWMATTQNSELKIKFSSAMGVLMPLAKPLAHWHMIAFVTVRTAQSTTQLVFVVLLEASSWFHPQIYFTHSICMHSATEWRIYAPWRWKRPESLVPWPNHGRMSRAQVPRLWRQCQQLPNKGPLRELLQTEWERLMGEIILIVFSACNRGLPLYRDRSTGVKQEPVYCQGADNGCNNPNYVCTTMGTLVNKTNIIRR